MVTSAPSPPTRGPIVTNLPIRRAHLIAALLAFGRILIFWASTVAVELLGSADAIRTVKQSIRWGLLALSPVLAVTGASGFRLGRGLRSATVGAKRRRMPIIAGIGILVLVASALYLAAAATRADYDGWFTAIQVLELLAGAVNLTLMSLNIRDGRRLTAGRRRIRQGCGSAGSQAP